jgi:hypothetical protein
VRGERRRDSAVTRTVSMPAITASGAEAQRVAEACESDLRVRLRVFNTSLADSTVKEVYLSIQAATLKGGAPTARAFVMRSGDSDTLFLTRGQSLFGVASASGTAVTVNSIGADPSEDL